VAARGGEIEIRPADPERDAALIRSVDNSFETEAIFEVQPSRPDSGSSSCRSIRPS
jgi:hypothetical protein